MKKAAGASSGATHLEAIKALMSDYDERENIFVFSKRVWESVQDGKEKTARRNVSASPSSQTTEAAHVEHLRPCWWLAANPKHWQFSRAAVGEDFPYTIISESGHKRQIFQNFLDAQAGDAVICYETTPTKKIQALAVVARPQNGQEIYFRKTTDLAAPIALEKLKGIKSLSNMEFFRRAQGTLFRLTPEEYGVIRGLIEDKKSDGLPAALEAACSKYSDDDFLHEVWLSAESLRRLKSLLERRKNLILQGPPGVGKTYAAKRLAWAMMGEKDDSRIAMVQFHQNYAYEDFIQGYKPDADGFSMKSGVFLDFCRKAGEDPQKRPHFFIIDEINRGNLSKIFGELMMLIEADHRGESLLLPATGEPFVVPENLYLIGMMNTADRSLAIIDYALRRRFSFVTMEPEFDSEGFRQLRSKVRNLLSEAGVQESIFEDLTSTIKSLNKAIKEDPALGKGFQIGHSYLSGVPLEGHSSPSWLDEFRDWLHEVVEYDLITLLEEYWFDNERALNDWSGVLRAAAGRLDARAS